MDDNIVESTETFRVGLESRDSSVIVVGIDSTLVFIEDDDGAFRHCINNYYVPGISKWGGQCMCMVAISILHLNSTQHTNLPLSLLCGKL